MKSRRLKTFLLAGTVSAFSMTAGHAQTAMEAVERLKVILGKQQFELTYESADADGDDVTLTGARLKYPETDDVVEIDEIALEDVTEEAGGALRVGRLAFDTALQEMDETTIEIEGFEVKGLILPKDAANDPYAGMSRYDSFAIESIEVDLRDQDLLSIENITGEMSLAADGALESTTEVESFTINLFALDDREDEEEFVDQLQEIDYDDIDGSLRTVNRWNPSDGRLTISEFKVAMEDLGTLNLTVDISGYTPDLIRGLQALLPEAGSDGSASGEEAGMAALGLIQQLIFNGMTIRFDDDSFTGRFLNLLANERGIAPDDLVAETRTMVEAQLAPLVGQAFAKSASEAIGDFLDDPKNIEISAQPPAPVPFLMLAAAVMGAPEMLIAQLGLKVTANQ